MKVRYNKYFPLLILLFVGIAYANSFRGAFLLDDTRAIVRNPKVRQILPREIGGYFSSRWFADATFALNYATGQLNPPDYHFTNFLIHAAAALLLYGIVRRTVESSAARERFRSRADGIAFLRLRYGPCTRLRLQRLHTCASVMSRSWGCYTWQHYTASYAEQTPYIRRGGTPLRY